MNKETGIANINLHYIYYLYSKVRMSCFITYPLGKIIYVCVEGMSDRILI